MKTTIHLLSILIIYIFTGLNACSERSDFEMKNDRIRSLIKMGSDSINVPSYFPDQDVRKYLHNEFNEFYKNRDYNLAWLEFHQPKEQADELLEALDAAGTHGLYKKNYDVTQIEELLASLYNIESKKERRKKWRKKLIKTRAFKKQLQEEDTARFNDIAQLDFLLTASYLTYASHLLSGRIDPNEKKDWFAPRRTKNLSKHLENAVDKNNIQVSLDVLAPSHEQYNLLREHLTHFKEAQNGEPIPQIGHTLTPGVRRNDVAHAKKRLSLWKNILSNVKDSLFFDDEMEAAVKEFQHIHGLEGHGEIKGSTLDVLNQPLSFWINKIETNMERLRWIQDDFGDRYLLVNIPAFELKVMNNGQPDLRMNIIVGTNYKKTPVFSDTLEYVVFNPEWNVPRSIAVEEMLPRIKRDPSYLKKRNLKLYDSWRTNAEPVDPDDVDWDDVDSTNWRFRIVESAGPTNALGRIKFMLPNENAIYLHDTPAGHLFGEKNRSFSHGCVRVEKPIALAEYLLDWERRKVMRFIDRKETKNVVLKEKMPVHIVYWSAWVDKQGRINFREDVYNYDEKHQKAIKKKQ